MCLLIQRCRSQRRSKKINFLPFFRSNVLMFSLCSNMCAKGVYWKTGSRRSASGFRGISLPSWRIRISINARSARREPRLGNESPRFNANICHETDRFSLFPVAQTEAIVESLLFLLGEIHVVFVRRWLKYQRESRQFPRKITQSPAQSKVVSDAEENNVEARIDFFRSSLLHWLSKSRNTKRSLAALGINHGIVKINYFGLMAQVARCDMFWEIFALVSRELFLAPFSE